jgi:hypothetical protein
MRIFDLAERDVESLVRLAGAGQLVLVAASLAIPRVLGWREEVSRSLRPLTRQVFWTWGGYIWTCHMAFGFLSTFGASMLADGRPLSRLVCAFIATWWSARIVIQFVYFDRSAAPPGRLYKLAEPALVLLFVSLASIYWLAAGASVPNP